MHARKEIRDILISKKIRHWYWVARCPLVDPRCPPTKARRNYWRLFTRYTHIAAALKLTYLSVYDY
jgi:hypothetical protein